MNRYIISALLLLNFAAFAFSQTPSPTPTPDALTLEKQRADRLQSRLNDFAQLGRYREANAQLQPPAKDEKRVVFLGDSITDSWKLAEYFPNQPFVNRGISGQTTPQMLIRMRPDVIALKPKVLVLLAGTNDIAGNYGEMTNEFIEGNIESIVELARQNDINVVLASILPISDYNKNKAGEPIIRSKQRPPERILALNNWIKNYAAQKNLVYLDYFSATVDDKGFLKAELAGDGLHPNTKGYEIMKPLAVEAINKALKMKPKK
jgi:lysophospholipase L1-like esterase